MRTPLSNNLKKIRTACGFTEEQLAALLNISCSTYANYEAGIRVMPVSEMEKTADVFGVELHTLLSDYEEVVYNMLVRSFCIEKLSSADMKEVIAFKKIVKNYLKLTSIAMPAKGTT